MLNYSLDLSSKDEEQEEKTGENLMKEAQYTSKTSFSVDKFDSKGVFEKLIANTHAMTLYYPTDKTM